MKQRAPGGDWVARRAAGGLILLVFLIAIVLRTYRLGAWSFWIDEAFTYNNALSWFVNLGSNPRHALIEHPITSLAVWTTTAVWGTTEWAARLAPAVLGAATPLLLYLPLARIFNRAVALLAMFLLAISPWHIYWSQNVRFYVLLLLFYTAALCALYFGLKTGQARHFLLFLLLAGLAMSERLLAVLLVPVTVAIFAGAWLLLPQRPAGLAWRNVLILLLPGVLLAIVFGWEFVQTPALWVDLFGQWAAEKGPRQLLREFVHHVGFITVALGGVGGVYLLYRRQLAGVVFAANAFVTPALLAIASLFQFVSARYMFVALVSWTLLAAVTAVTIVHHSPQKARGFIIAALALALIAGPALANAAYYASDNGDRNNWKAAYTYLRPLLAANDLVVSSVPEVGAFYLQRDVPGMTEDSFQIDPQAFSESGARIWFVTGSRARVSPQLQKWVEQNGRQVFFDGQTIRVWVYPPPDDP